MPGIENFAPDRTDTSSGFDTSPSFLPGGLFELAQVVFDLAIDLGWDAALLGVVDVADAGGDGEPGRHRQAGVGHLGEARALAAEHVLHRPIAVRLAGAEEEDVLLRARLLRRAPPPP